MNSGVCFGSYLDSINCGPDFFVYIYIEFLSDFQGSGERVRYFILQNSGTSPATHLDFQACTFNKGTCFFAFEDLVLQGSALNRLPVRLFSIHSKRILWWRKPEICPAPNLVSRIDR